MLTIRTLLKARELGLRALVPDGEYAFDSPLRWLHNTELLDPGTYLRERELVLTNGLWHDGGNGAEFAANVSRAGGAGIVFGLRRETKRTPPDLIDACREHQLPLLELPIEVPFTEVTKRAAGELAGARQQELVDAVRRGDDLAAAISRGAGATGVLKVLRRDHHLPLAVVDRMGRVLAEAGAHLDSTGTRVVAQGLQGHPPPLEVELGSGGMGSLFLVNTLAGADAALVCLRPLGGLSEVERAALTQAAHYLSLEVARNELMRAIESRFAHELLEMILSGNRADEVPARLEAFGIRPDGPLGVLAVALNGDGPHADATLAQAVGEFFPAAGIPAVVVPGSHDVVVIFPWSHPSDDMVDLARRLVAKVNTAVAAAPLVVGLGGVADQCRLLRVPLSQARDACQALRRGSRKEGIAHLKDLGTHRLLLAAHNVQLRSRLAESVLGPLRKHDATRDAQLELTVRTFLENDGHFAGTAAALYIHVNTLRNRLGKVADLTGRDVTTTEGRVDVFLALEADAMPSSE